MKKIISLVLVLALGLASPSLAEEYTWTQKTDMPTPRWFHSANVVDDNIYVIGGWPSEPSDVGLSTVESYDPTTDTWTKKADMLNPRGYHSSSVVNGNIYVIGGCGFDYKELSTVEEYDPTTDTWTKKADMPTSRFCLSTCAVDGKIYAIGGAVWGDPVTSTRGMSTVEVYDPLTDAWTMKADMPIGVWGLSASVVDDKIYAIGGSPGIFGGPKVQEYDPADDSWTVEADMPTGRRNFSTSVLFGEIYAIGGWLASGRTPYSAVEVYDPRTDSWRLEAYLPVVRSSLTTSVVNCKIYAIGGTDRPHPCPATSTVYELTISGPPPDFNGDGLVDIKDLLRLIESWGQDDPEFDIAPPFGDGVIDVFDLEFFLSFWGQPIDDSTLIAHWPLDETEGIVAYDSVGDNNAYVIGGPAWQPEGGRVDGALQLDGIDDFVRTLFVLNPADGKFSIFAWVKGGAPGQAVLSQAGGMNWLCTDSLEGNLMTELKVTGQGATELLSQTIIIDGDWHRIGLVWDGSNRTLYVDGVAVAEDVQDALFGSDRGLYIGAGRAMEPGSFWSGLIDDVRIYNRAVRP